jgi:dTDP-4-dehydrorhamnose reductase
MRINAEAPGRDGAEARLLGAAHGAFFDRLRVRRQQAGAYVETDAPCPINVYGAQQAGRRTARCREPAFRT